MSRVADGVYVRMGETPTLDGNTLLGYAAVFNSPTEINSWEGRFVEVIRPGAFTRTIANRGDKIKVLYDHGLDPSIGNKPLGVPAVLREDHHGVYFEVPLDDTSYNNDLKASLRSGAIDGASFRFTVPKNGDRWSDDGDLPTRELVEINLHEFGPVTFPAYEAASAGIRSRDAYQQWLRGCDRTETNFTIVEGDPVDGWRTYTKVATTTNLGTEPAGSVRDTPADPPKMALAKRFEQLNRRVTRVLSEHQ